MIIEKNILIKRPTGLYHKYYKELGYDISGKFVEIDISHLSFGSKEKIKVSCDYCNLIKYISYNDYNKTTKNGELKYACKDCGSIKQKELCLEKNGVENYFQLEKIKENIKIKNKEKYGVENYTQTDDYKKKYKKTCLEKYGVENVSQLDSTKDKVKETSLRKYGCESYSKTDDCKEKISNTNFKKYGKKSYSQTNEFIEKVKKTNFEKYGKLHFQSTDEWKNKMKDIIFFKYGVNHITKSEDIRRKNFEICKNTNYLRYLEDSVSIFFCDVENHEFEIGYDIYKSRIKYNVNLCTICNPIEDKKSIREKELFQYIQEIYKGRIIQSYRDVLEIDIYLPDLNLGFEFNGIYWHSDIYREKKYHLNKLNYYKERGIRIINVWEDDWINKKPIIESQIGNLLGMSSKIGARKCEVREIEDAKTVRDFLNQNHIQGSYPNINKSIGLYYNDDLVSIMTFDHFEGRKKMSENEWNLSRFCNKLEFSIIGGASKLLKYFIDVYSTNRIISYADKSWSDGNLYEAIGFNKLYETNPDYKYIINGIRKHKSLFRKSKTGVSEKELNIPKIWDCGKIKYILIKNYLS